MPLHRLPIAAAGEDAAFLLVLRLSLRRGASPSPPCVPRRALAWSFQGRPRSSARVSVRIGRRPLTRRRLPGQRDVGVRVRCETLNEPAGGDRDPKEKVDADRQSHTASFLWFVVSSTKAIPRGRARARRSTAATAARPVHRRRPEHGAATASSEPINSTRNENSGIR